MFKVLKTNQNNLVSLPAEYFKMFLDTEKGQLIVSAVDKHELIFIDKIKEDDLDILKQVFYKVVNILNSTSEHVIDLKAELENIKQIKKEVEELQKRSQITDDLF